MKRLCILAALFLAACGQPNAPRRDLVLFLAGSPPSNPGAHFKDLNQRALVYLGNLRAPDAQLEAPTGIALRVEVFTGLRHPSHLTSVSDFLPSLSEAARLAGRHARGFTTPGGINTESGFDHFLSKERKGGLASFESATDFAPALETELGRIVAHAKSRGAKRGPLLLCFDFASEADSGLAFESVLDRLQNQGIGQGADFVVLFTDSNSSQRAMVSSPTVEPMTRQDFVDPRDIYVTATKLGRIPLPEILHGRDLVEIAQPAQ